MAFVTIFVEWNPDITRVLLPAVALGAPLLAAIRGTGKQATALVLSSMALAACVVANPFRKLIEPGDAQVAACLDRIDQITQNRLDMRPALHRLEDEVPSIAPLGFTGLDDSWDYPLFGEHLDRRVVRMDRLSANVEAARRERVTAIVFANVEPPENSGLELEVLAPGYVLGTPGTGN